MKTKAKHGDQNISKLALEDPEDTLKRKICKKD